jgi:hypothetical protein
MANTRTTKSTSKPSTAKQTVSSKKSTRGGASPARELKGDIATARNTGKSTTSKGK